MMYPKGALARGYYFQPTLLDRVNMRVAQEEIFGPVLAMIGFDDLEQAAEIANRSQYGLVAGIWTRDIDKAMSLASRIKSGQVYVNTYGAGGGVELPFGGYKKCGYGREKGTRIAGELYPGQERVYQVHGWVRIR